MNKAVKFRYNNFSKKMFGQGLLVLIYREPKFYEKYKSFYDGKGQIPDPIPLVKYLIRKHTSFGHGDQKKMLEELKEPIDPYGTINFCRFGGRFAYDYDEKGFLPVYVEMEGTQVMKAIWDRLEPKRVEKAWAEAQKYLQAPDGGEPKLAYETE